MLNIFIGILILSFVVFIHELGHFIAAISCGVDVEAFSIGFGPVLLKKTIGKTEYRVSLLPLGGYCSMKGEQAFMKSVENNLLEIPEVKGAFYSVSRLKRIIIAFAGPFFNYLLAIICFAIVSSIGTTYFTSSNKIAPVYYYDALDNSPAKQSDLRMGDRIIKIDETEINNFDDILKIVSVSAEEELNFVVERDGSILNKKITPKLNKKTGAGIVGFYSFVPLKISDVVKGSPSDEAGMLPSDEIIAVNDMDVYNTQDLLFYLQSNKELKEIVLTVVRNEEKVKLNVILPVTDKEVPNLGFINEGIKVVVAGTGFFSSIRSGFIETNKSFLVILKSLKLLFKGVDLKSAISGPLSISNMLGETARIGFKESFFQGLSNISYFISFICISLFIMNLLPIPVLDGGLIFVTLIEILVRRPIPPKILYYIQLCGFVIMMLLFVFVLWNDISHLLA